VLADFENFLEPRIVLSDQMESDLEPIIALLVKTDGPLGCMLPMVESIDRMLNVFEKVNKEIPFNGLRWFFDHAETIYRRSIGSREKSLAVESPVQCQNVLPRASMYKKMYGEPTGQVPPIRRMLEKQIPVEPWH
jgi:predicted amidohydrolase YtcJ